MDVFEQLKAPFPPEKVSWRVGSTNKEKTSGLALAYIDARDVMQRLDDVVGANRWQVRYSHADKKTICELSIYCLYEGSLSGEWVTKANGAGDSDIEAEKGAISDAFKRAAVLWGIGRYLYELPNVWVDLEQRGNTSVIKKGQEGKLAAALNGVAPQPEKPKAPTLAETLAYVTSLKETERLQWAADNEDKLKTLKATKPEAYAKFTALGVSVS